MICLFPLGYRYTSKAIHDMHRLVQQLGDASHFPTTILPLRRGELPHSAQPLSHLTTASGYRPPNRGTRQKKKLTWWSIPRSEWRALTKSLPTDAVARGDGVDTYYTRLKGRDANKGWLHKSSWLSALPATTRPAPPRKYRPRKNRKMRVCYISIYIQLFDLPPGSNETTRREKEEEEEERRPRGRKNIFKNSPFVRAGEVDAHDEPSFAHASVLERAHQVVQAVRSSVRPIVQAVRSFVPPRQNNARLSPFVRHPPCVCEVTTDERGGDACRGGRDEAKVGPSMSMVQCAVQEEGTRARAEITAVVGGGDRSVKSWSCDCCCCCCCYVPHLDSTRPTTETRFVHPRQRLRVEEAWLAEGVRGSRHPRCAIHTQERENTI